MAAADMWLGNLTGWWQVMLGMSVVLFLLWFGTMRTCADQVWPEGQRRHVNWGLFGWLVPVGQLFLPKMFMNDLWAAAQPATQRRRGNPLLTVWWFSVLAAGNVGSVRSYAPLKRAFSVMAARAALEQVMLGDGLRVAAALLTVVVVWRLSGMMSAAVAEQRKPLGEGELWP